MDTRAVSLRRILDIVDRVIVLSLSTSLERQRAIAETLKQHDLPFQFLFGRDTRTSSIEALEGSGDYNSTRRASSGRSQLTPGEIGCALSHRGAAESMLEGSDSRILILEDDAIVTAGGAAEIGTSLQSMPAKWSLAYFGYQSMNLSAPLSVRVKLASLYQIAHLLGSKRHDPDSIRRIYARSLNSHWMHAGWFNNAHAYAIDRSAAEFIASAQTPVSMEADVALGHLVRFSGLSAVCQTTPLFEQATGTPSTIGARPSWK